MSSFSVSDFVENGELDDLTLKVEFMLQQLKIVSKFVNKFHERVNNGDFDGTQHGMSLLDTKCQLLLMYCARLCLYINMRSNGESVANHELLNQMAIATWILDKFRTIQKQCQYSIDKLVQHSKNAISKNVSSSSKMNDKLLHRPNLLSLRLPNTEDMNADENEESNKTPDMMMDKHSNQLSKKQKRVVLRMKKSMRNTELFQSIQESMTNRPTEERFFITNVEKFSSNRNIPSSKTKLRDYEIIEEDTFKRVVQSRFEMKKDLARKRLREASIGNNLDTFVGNLDKDFRKANRLADFEGGAKYHQSIAKYNKKRLKGGRYIKGSWKRRERILWKHSMKGKRVLSRKKWRKSHPLKKNPAKSARMVGHRFKKSRKVRRLLKKLR